MVPFFMAVAIGSLLLFPPRFRYAAFLTAVTTSLVSFCPQAKRSCTMIFPRKIRECYMTVPFAFTRGLSVSLGVIFALLFHIFFWPRFAQKEARSILSKAFLCASRLFADQQQMYFHGTDLVSGDNGNLTRVPSQQEKSMARTNLKDRERLYKTVTTVDIYPNSETELSKRIFREVDSGLRAALVLIGDASVLNLGPMKMSPLLPQICDEFVSLSVSLHQMAHLLNRVPLLTGAYGRSAIDKYITPCLYEYETVQVSLHSVVNSVSRALTERSRRSLENSYDDLVRCANHLAEARGELAKAIRSCSSVAVVEPSPPDHMVGEYLHDREWCSGSLCIEQRGCKNLSPAIFPLRRSATFDDNLLREDYDRSSTSICPDDAVLYISFSFAATSCLNAFSRIVCHVLTDVERILSLPDGGRKWYEVHLGVCPARRT